MHVRSTGDGAVECVLPSTRDDDRIAEVVESMGERRADPGAAARDENGVAGHFHRMVPLVVDGRL